MLLMIKVGKLDVCGRPLFIICSKELRNCMEILWKCGMELGNRMETAWNLEFIVETI